jgi:molecular chaperone GrpE (heat shock protein)
VHHLKYKREIERVREEFKNREQKSNMSERVARLERKMENEERRSEGKSKQQIKHDIEIFIKKTEEAKSKIGTT